VQASIAGKKPDAAGGSATVFRTELRRQMVAVKVVALAGLPDSYRTLLAGEISLLASMGRHPNIVQLRGCVLRALLAPTPPPPPLCCVSLCDAPKSPPPPCAWESQILIFSFAVSVRVRVRKGRGGWGSGRRSGGRFSPIALRREVCVAHPQVRPLWRRGWAGDCGACLWCGYTSVRGL
jgi:hypothetical protein